MVKGSDRIRALPIGALALTLACGQKPTDPIGTAALTPAPAPTPSAAPSASASAEEALEDDEDLDPDDLSDAFPPDEEEEVTPDTPGSRSTFPYAFTGAPPKPFTQLIDDRLATAVRDYSCTTGTDHRYVPYFPGIQGFNDGSFSLKAKLGGDKATADLYVKFAKRSTAPGSTSDIQGWSLLFYYNMPSVAVDDPVEPTFVEPLSGDADGRGVRVFGRANRSTFRLRRHGDAAREGDQVEVRLLGLWASTPKDEDFGAISPDLSHDAQGDRDAIDLERFKSSVVDDDAFRSFVYRAAYEVAVAWKCGTPVFAHSGGGAIVTLVARLLAASRLHDEMVAWKTDFRVLGLEAVLSEDMRARLKDALAHVTMNEFVVGAEGSKTWKNVIVPEEKQCGFTPLGSQPVTESVDPPGWNGDAGGHGGLGFFALLNGRLPGVAKWIAH
ncbi:MAG: hypothetical protein U0414_14625 [Polyangiaceae bacterium]